MSIYRSSGTSTPSLSSVKNLCKHLKDESESYNSKCFLPFVNERDSTGKLITSNTNRSSSMLNLEDNKVRKIARYQKSDNSNVAFLTSIKKTSARVSKKSNDFTPVGLYNPPSIYEVHSKKSLPISKSVRFLEAKNQKKACSIDMVDMNELYRKNSKKIPSVSIEKQLFRPIFHKKNDISEKLMIPRVDLPEYLKKFKGLYHIGEFSKTDIFPLQKDADEMSNTILKKMTKHMFYLRNITSYYKEFGLNPKWNVSLSARDKN